MDIIDHYPYFESNQVLTHTQLNELFNYLDNQNRLTRCRLIGIGIVCGLDVEAPATVDETTIPIKISAGIGITSEGYLVALKEAMPKYHREYKIPEGEKYDPFQYIDTTVSPAETKQYELFELIDEADFVESTDTGIDAGFLEDKVVIVFLEMYDYDPRSCLVRSCDEIGQTTYIKPRILVATTDIAEKIRENTNLVPAVEDIFEDRFGLETLAIKRVLLNSDNYDGSLLDLFSKYRDAIPDIETVLQPAIESTYNVYKPILQPLYGQEPNELTQMADIMSTWSDYLSTENSAQDYFGMQYFYDFIKDLILAYDEFRFTAFDVVTKCNIDTELFPRHLFLGEAYPDISDHDPQLNRNTFTQPYIYKHLTENIEKIKSLHQRMVQMILNFNFEYINNPDNGLDLKITPSKEKGSQLSERAIPYYYSVTDGDSKLLENWNYELTRRRLKDENLSYHASNYATGKDNIIHPLEYNYDNYPFLRVEGNNSKEAENILLDLENDRKTFNLPFQIKLIDINTTTADVEVEDYRAWKDLQTEYLGIRDNILCQVQKLISSLKVPEGDEYQTECSDLIDAIKENYNNIVNELPYELNSVDYNNVNTQINNLYENLIEFILYIKHLFGKLISEQFSILSSQEFHERKQELNEMYYAIRRFMSGCQLYSLTTIIYRYQLRIDYLKTNSTQILQNFIARHPGLEHMAGVPKGGTYIMVHDNVTVAEAEVSRIVADFALPYSCCSESIEIPSPEDELSGLELPPVAVTDSFLVSNEEASVELDVLNNDLQRNAYPIKITDVSENDNVSFDGEKISYNPPEEPANIDKFEYTIAHTEGNALTSSAVVKILVRDPYKVYPKPSDDIDFTDISTAIEIDVLKNDYYNEETKIEIDAGTSELGASVEVVNNSGKEYIRYSPSVAGRDSFKYRLKDSWRDPEFTSEEGEVRVYVTELGGGSYSAPEIVQRNSSDNEFSVLLDSESGSYELLLIDSSGNKVESCPTENGNAKIASVDGKDMIFYTPNAGYFGSDKLSYYIEFTDGTNRTGEVNILVVCCCIELPDYEIKVKPFSEETHTINYYNSINPELKFTAIGQHDRDIVITHLLDDTNMLMIPTDDIVYCGTYSFDVFATDSNNNCYKGKITIHPEKTEVDIPDHDVHIVSMDPIIIRPEIIEKYNWIISSISDFDTACGTINLLGSSRALQYIPSDGITNVLVETFKYNAKNAAGEILTGNINLINLIEKVQAYVDFVLVHEANPTKPQAGARFGSAVDIFNDLAIVGAPNYPFNNTTNSGAVVLYEKNSPGNWSLIADLSEIAENVENALLGSAVGLTTISGNGDFAFLGAPGTGSSMGLVYVLQRKLSGSNWEMLPLLLPEDAVKNDLFGSRIALYDFGAIISSPGKTIATNNKGCVYIYGYKDSSWVEYQVLIASQAMSNIIFGFSLDLYQRTIVVGAYNEKGSDEGFCYVFEYNTESQKYEEKKILTAPDSDSASGFGYAVSVYGDWIAVSSVNDDGSKKGRVILYRRNESGDWNFEVMLMAQNEVPGNRFGQSVSFYNDLLAVGSMPLEPSDSSPECVDIFKLEQGNWNHKQRLQKTVSVSRFGVACQLHNKELIVGAEMDISGTIRTGGISIYEQL
jgi:hypothetical protein